MPDVTHYCPCCRHPVFLRADDAGHCSDCAKPGHEPCRPVVRATPRAPAAAEALHPDSARLDAMQAGQAHVDWSYAFDPPRCDVEVHGWAGSGATIRAAVDDALRVQREMTRKRDAAAEVHAPHPAGPRGVGEAPPCTCVALPVEPGGTLRSLVDARGCLAHNYPPADVTRYPCPRCGQERSVTKGATCPPCVYAEYGVIGPAAGPRGDAAP